MPATSSTTPRGFVPALTGIRAIAALWVLVAHYSSFLVDDFNFPRDSILQPLFRSAYAGVDLFFVLSGFIIAYTYYDSFLTRSWRGSPDFWWKRFARIYPVYIVTTVLSAVMYAVAIAVGHQFRNADGAVLNWPTAILNVMGIQEWFSVPSLNGPAWSVSAELFAYMLFPAMAVLTIRVSHRSSLAVLIGLFTLSLTLTYHQHLVSPRIWQVFFEFLTGFFTYRIFAQTTRATSYASTWWFRGGIWALVLVVVYLSGLYGREAHFALAPLCAIVVWSYAQESGRKSRLDSRTMVNLGLWSYSLYLIHRPLQGVASGLHLRSTGNALIDGLLFTLLLVVAVASSWFLYRFVEEPARRFLAARPYFRAAGSNIRRSSRSSSA